MRVVFRVDASLEIGTGHVMRCLTLADELHRRGVTAGFLCRTAPGDMTELIRSRGYDIHVLAGVADDAAESVAHVAQSRPDWVVVDHYSLGRSWESAMRPHATWIFAIDDLADRDHDCDLLLDQNLYEGVERRYAPRVPSHCRQLIGPHYALLRPEFARSRSSVSRTARPVSKLLVSFGGVDTANETGRVLAAFDGSELSKLAVDVVMGLANPHLDAIKDIARRRRTITLHVGTSKMAELMSEADAFIGAGGSTTWERFCLGLPSLVIAVAENQVPTSQYLGKLGAIDYIGTGARLSVGDIRAALVRFLRDHDGRSRMTELGMQLVDGHGAQRVSECMLTFAAA